MNDLDWVPSNHEQAEDRCYRLGQSKTVNIYYPIVDNTIDVMLYEVLQEKKNIINTIMGDDGDDERGDVMGDFLKTIINN